MELIKSYRTARKNNISMSSLSLLHSLHFNNEYVTQLAPTTAGILAVLSNASLHLINADKSTLFASNAHTEGAVSAKSLDDNVISTCGSDGLKLWDIRTRQPVWSAGPENQAPLLSLDTCAGTFVAAGTELKGADAGVLVWDTRSSKQLVSYVDSHNDDVTEVKFHPLRSNILLSGSTDGLVNVYDTTITDEEEAVIQGIKFASVNKTGFLADDRIFCLSHMETFSIFHATNPDANDNDDIEPVNFGDVREKWDCEYVCDILTSPGLVAVGSNTRQSFKLLPFQNEQVDLSGAYDLPGAHGEEVVRTVIINDNSVYTGGEDGIVRIWSGPPPQESKKSKKDKHKHKDDKKKKKKKKTRFEPY